MPVGVTNTMMHLLLGVLDLGGTFVFAISGALAGVKHHLDVFGVLVLSFAAGNAGGIIRDLLIGAVPPAAIAGLSPVMAALLGMLTGVGGGTLRDVLVAEISVVLRADLYALAALAGATAVVGGHALHVSPITTTVVGGAFYVSRCALWRSVMVGICPRPR